MTNRKKCGALRNKFRNARNFAHVQKIVYEWFEKYKIGQRQAIEKLDVAIKSGDPLAIKCAMEELKGKHHMSFRQLPIVIDGLADGVAQVLRKCTNTD